MKGGDPEQTQEAPRPSAPRPGLLRRVYRCKWGCLRLLVAAFLLWVVAVDTPARLARLELASMPGFDYAKEVQSLRLANRFGEAEMVARSGLEQVDDAGNPVLTGDDRARLDNELVQTLAEQDSWLRRAKDAGLGALSGRADSLEGLIGAVAADFFVVGDVRDLVIEGGKLALDGESDEVVLALSGVGLATTLAPEVDWAPSLLKAARRAGTLTRRLGEQIVTFVRQGKKGEIVKVLEDAATLSKKASPGGAMRMLRHAENADELSLLARFVEHNPGGALALHVGGERGATIVKDAAKLGAEEGARAERALARAAAKGERGVEFLGTRAGRTLLKPHMLVGLTKALWKGNAAKLAQQLVDRLGAHAMWALPLLAAWCFVELVLIARKLAHG